MSEHISALSRITAGSTMHSIWRLQGQSMWSPTVLAEITYPIHHHPCGVDRQESALMVRLPTVGSRKRHLSTHIVCFIRCESIGEVQHQSGVARLQTLAHCHDDRSM